MVASLLDAVEQGARLPKSIGFPDIVEMRAQACRVLPDTMRDQAYLFERGADRHLAEAPAGASDEPRWLAPDRAALRAGQMHQDVLMNYRDNGEAYWCGLEIHPVLGRSGQIELFVAFEAEMVRRRGRPGPGLFGRFARRDPRAVFPGECEKGASPVSA